jgi:hypothetical protein
VVGIEYKHLISSTAALELNSAPFGSTSYTVDFDMSVYRGSDEGWIDDPIRVSVAGQGTSMAATGDCWPRTRSNSVTRQV